MSRPRNRRPVRSAAISVVPEPRKMSSTSSPRRVTSWMRVGDQRRRLHRRVQRQVLAPAAGHRVHRGVVPDVGAVAAVPAELDRVEVRRLADPVDEDELVLRAIERAHAGVRLVPDAEVQELAVDRAADRRSGPRGAASPCRRSAPRRRATPWRRRRASRRGSSGTPPRSSRPRPWRTRGAGPWRWHGR